jgi:hypothetical protein
LIVRVVSQELNTDEYYYDDAVYDVAVKVGQTIKPKQIIARSKIDKQKINATFA